MGLVARVGVGGFDEETTALPVRVDLKFALAMKQEARVKWLSQAAAGAFQTALRRAPVGPREHLYGGLYNCSR